MWVHPLSSNSCARTHRLIRRSTHVDCSFACSAMPFTIRSCCCCQRPQHSDDSSKKMPCTAAIKQQQRFAGLPPHPDTNHQGPNVLHASNTHGHFHHAPRTTHHAHQAPQAPLKAFRHGAWQTAHPCSCTHTSVRNHIRRLFCHAATVAVLRDPVPTRAGEAVP